MTSRVGRQILVGLNGERVSELNGVDRDPQGHVALQCHDEGSVVRFRRLLIAVL